ncbi:MAG: Wzz/FepE/Etk N-terminal domain-containing protein [Clostridiales bacterium]
MEELSLIDIGSIIMRNKWLLLIFTVVFALGAFLVSVFLVTPKYTATASLYVNNGVVPQDGLGTSISDITAAQELVGTYIQILNSETAITSVIEKLNLPYTVAQVQNMITMSAKNETEVLEIKVTTTSSEESILIANTLLETAPSILIRIVKAASVETIDYAVLAPKVSPGIAKNTAIGALLGLVLGVFLSLTMSILDRRIRGEDDLTKRYNLPILAIVPNVHSYERKGGDSKYGYK